MNYQSKIVRNGDGELTYIGHTTSTSEQMNAAFETAKRLYPNTNPDDIPLTAISDNLVPHRCLWVVDRIACGMEASYIIQAWKDMKRTVSAPTCRAHSERVASWLLSAADGIEIRRIGMGHL